MKAALFLLLAGCVDTTGSALVSFHAAAAGPSDATGVLESDTGLGYHVVVTEAKLHVGALYLRTTLPTSGAQGQPCILPGASYSGEVREGLDIDLLLAEPQAFPEDGDGTADLSPTGEAWLVGGPVESPTDPTAIVTLAGTATQGDAVLPFTASVTIAAANRGIDSSDPSQPGANPICKQRIVTPIAAGFAPSEGGTLLLRADPRRWLANTEFSEVPPDPDVPGAVRFLNDDTDQQSLNLFNAVRAASTYSMTFSPKEAP